MSLCLPRPLIACLRSPEKQLTFSWASFFSHLEADESQTGIYICLARSDKSQLSLHGMVGSWLALAGIAKLHSIRDSLRLTFHTIHNFCPYTRPFKRYDQPLLYFSKQAKSSKNSIILWYSAGCTLNWTYLTNTLL